MKTYLITGAAGFIGSNFIKYMLKKYPERMYILLDKLTYAANLKNIEEELKKANVIFVQGDICDSLLVKEIFVKYNIDYVVNFAAESHVDRSIANPRIFLETNILGVQNLMDRARECWTTGKDEKGYPIYASGKKFLQISTDEVYGSLEKDIPDGKELSFQEEDLNQLIYGRRETKAYGNQFFTEETPVNPNSPYSVSKTSADLLVKAYYETYHFPMNITRCSNNYGQFQHEEKLIPLMIKSALSGKELPVYGDGMNVRDWLYVEDHCKAIDMVLSSGRNGEVYNIGGFNEKTNLYIIHTILEEIAKYEKSKPRTELIRFVEDRLGHDRRYAINPRKIVQELGWYPETTFEDGIKQTIQHFMKEWIWNKNI